MITFQPCARENLSPSLRGLAVLIVVLLGFAYLPLGAQQDSAGDKGFLDDLFILKSTKTARISSYDKTGGNHDFITIGPGKTETLAEIPGAGIIRRFYIASYSPDRMRYRKLILRMYWDGADRPCVEVPLGDFFGSGLGTLRYFKSLVVNINPGQRSWDFDGLVNYLPMPFEKGTRITLENDGQVPDLYLWYHVDYEQYPDGALPINAGRLHAQWRRVDRTPVRPGVPKNTTAGNDAAKNTTGEDNYVILDAEGQGSYVGLFLTVDNIAGGWYGEGDDMIFVDGARWPPTYPGTGHEEIFNSGCCPNSEFWGPYTGFYLIENLRGDFGGKNQMYRFYINDPVHFQKSIRVTVEHGHANNFENDYTSTAFWYQKDPHKPFPALPGAIERLPGWPAGVKEALEMEVQLARKLLLPVDTGNIHLSEADAKVLRQLRIDATESFRALHHQDYLRAVQAMESISNHYQGSKP